MNRTDRRRIAATPAERKSAENRKRAVLIVAVAVPALLILVAVVLFNNRAVQNASVAPIQGTAKVGAPAPTFAVATTGGLFDLSRAGGKPTLLEVFATWCPHCQREAQTLDALHAKYGSRVNIVAVSGAPDDMDRTAPESQADVLAFAEKYKVAYPIAFDPNLDVAHKYLQDGYPTLVLIAKDGTVSAIRAGEVPLGDLATALDASLAGKTPDPKIGLKS